MSRIKKYNPVARRFLNFLKPKTRKFRHIERESDLHLIESNSIICGIEKEHVVLNLKGKKPFFLTGYIDASSLFKEDTIEILIYVTINSVEKLYAVHEQKGTDREEVLSFSRLVVPGGVKVCIKQTVGGGKKISYLFIAG